MSKNVLSTTFYARYVQHTPDPGVCRIVSIDWETRRLSMSNGSARYHPTFKEVNIVPPPEGAEEKGGDSE